MKILALLLLSFNAMAYDYYQPGNPASPYSDNYDPFYAAQVQRDRSDAEQERFRQRIREDDQDRRERERDEAVRNQRLYGRDY